MVDAWGEAYICDFGFGRIRHDISRTNTSVQSGGKNRFVAPELTSASVARATQASDIYSLAMTVFTLGSGTPPLATYQSNRSAIIAAEDGERPGCPYSFGGLDSENTRMLYDLLGDMWLGEPDQRLSAAAVENRIEVLVHQHASAASLPTALGSSNSAESAGLSHLELDQTLSTYDWSTVDAGSSLFQSSHPSQWHSLIHALLGLALEPMLDALSRVPHLTELFKTVKIFCPEATFQRGFSGWMDTRPFDDGVASDSIASVVQALIAAGVSRWTARQIFERAGAEGKRLMMTWDEQFEAQAAQSEDSMTVDQTSYSDVVMSV